MATVVTRINQITQPYGGYVPVKLFEELKLGGEIILNDNEALHASLVGVVVDYLTRFMINKNPKEAFDIPLRGALKATEYYYKTLNKKTDYFPIALYLLNNIRGLDNESISNACKISYFDIWYRNPRAALHSEIEKSIPDESTIKNIKMLVNRNIAFFEKNSPIIKYGFDLKGGYTKTVTNGDGDYLAKDTLWDLKVSKSKPRSNDTLQILMYWIMGQHSGQEIFKSITKIGIFNPRLNTAYQLQISKIQKEVIEAVEKDVICY